jgi:hypothetical protein
VLDKPRQMSVVGGGMKLPGARVVTQIVHPTFTRDDRINTHIVMQWGQFLDHDLTLTPVVPLENADCEFFTQVINRAKYVLEVLKNIPSLPFVCYVIRLFVFVMHSWRDQRNREHDVISLITKPVSPRMHNK